jgi:hypothetical protein
LGKLGLAHRVEAGGSRGDGLEEGVDRTVVVNPARVVQAALVNGGGNVVLAGPAGANPDDQLRIYFQDGLVQNTLDAQNRSQSFFTYGLEGLVQSFKPRATRALVLGLGAGVVPMSLARHGIEVTAVEIDPVSGMSVEPGKGVNEYFYQEFAPGYQAEQIAEPDAPSQELPPAAPLFPLLN